MANPEFPIILKKIKSSAVGAVNKVKESAKNLAKFTKSKSEVIAAVKADESPKKKESKIKLDYELRITIDRYNDAYTTLNDTGVALYNERTRAVDMILHVETLVNSISNHPKEFDIDIKDIQTHRMAFTGVCEFAKEELETAKKSALSIGAGVATGATIVSVAPTAAMWVATTFGTASTGTAISTLSGAAATNAALAWLGGGALTAGGGGMAAGHALLALAGPIGWGVAGVTLLSSIVLFSVKKIKLNKKKKEEIEAVKKNTGATQKMTANIQELLDEVIGLRDRLNQQYNECLSVFGKDFVSINVDWQMQLGTLVNNTKALAASLGKSIQ